MRTKMIIAAVAMAALIMASFGVMAVDDNDAAGSSSMIGYGETTTGGITDIVEYWEYTDPLLPATDVGYLELKLQSTSPEQVFIYVDYVDDSHYGERQGLFSISSEMTILLENMIVEGEHSIKIITKSGTTVVTIPLTVYADQTITVSADNTNASVAEYETFAGGSATPASIIVKQGQTLHFDGDTITVAGQTVTATPTTEQAEKYHSEFNHWVIFGEDKTGTVSGDVEVPATATPATIVAVFEVSYVYYEVSPVAAAGTNSTGLDIRDLGTIAAPAASGTGEEDEITFEATVAVADGVLTITSDDGSTVIYTASDSYTSTKYTAVFDKWQINGIDATNSSVIDEDAIITALYIIDLKPIAVTIDLCEASDEGYATSVVSSGAVDPAINWTPATSWASASFNVPWGSIVTVKDGVLTITDLRGPTTYIVTATPADPDDNYVYTASWKTSEDGEIVEGSKIKAAIGYNILFAQEDSAYIKVNAAAYKSDSTYDRITAINVACNSQIKPGNDVTVKVSYANAAAAAAEVKGYTYSFYTKAYGNLPETADYSSATAVDAANIVKIGPGVFVIGGIDESSTILVKATPFTNVEDNLATFFIKGIAGNQITTVIESKDSSLIGDNQVRYTASYKYMHPQLGKEVYTTAVCVQLTDVVKDVDGNTVTSIVDGESYHAVISTLDGTPTRTIFSAQALYTTSAGVILDETLWTTA